MKVVIEIPDSQLDFYRAYSRAVRQSVEETMLQVLGDFAFGVIEDGFNPKESPKANR